MFQTLCKPIIRPFVKYMIGCQYDYIRQHNKSLASDVFFPDKQYKTKIIKHQVEPITNLILGCLTNQQLNQMKMAHGKYNITFSNFQEVIALINQFIIEKLWWAPNWLTELIISSVNTKLQGLKHYVVMSL